MEEQPHLQQFWAQSIDLIDRCWIDESGENSSILRRGEITIREAVVKQIDRELCNVQVEIEEIRW